MLAGVSQNVRPSMSAASPLSLARMCRVGDAGRFANTQANEAGDPAVDSRRQRVVAVLEFALVGLRAAPRVSDNPFGPRT